MFVDPAVVGASLHDNTKWLQVALIVVQQQGHSAGQHDNMANKTARFAWALLKSERIYQPTPA